MNNWGYFEVLKVQTIIAYRCQFTDWSIALKHDWKLNIFLYKTIICTLKCRWFHPCCSTIIRSFMFLRSQGIACLLPEWCKLFHHPRCFVIPNLRWWAAITLEVFWFLLALDLRSQICIQDPKIQSNNQICLCSRYSLTVNMLIRPLSRLHNQPILMNHKLLPLSMLRGFWQSLPRVRNTWRTTVAENKRKNNMKITYISRTAPNDSSWVCCLNFEAVIRSQQRSAASRCPISW